MTAKFCVAIGLSGAAGVVVGYLWPGPVEETKKAVASPFARPPAAITAPAGPPGAQNPAAHSHAFAEALEFASELDALSAAELPRYLDQLLKLRKDHTWSRYNERIGPLAARWADVDPVGGARHALDAGENWLARAVWSAWARKSFDVALRAAETWEPESQRSVLLGAAMSELGKRAPPEFRERLLRGELPADGYIDDDVLSQAIRDLAARDVDRAIAAVEHAPVPNRRNAIFAMAGALARTNSDFALGWALARKDRNERIAALESVAIEVGTRDPDRAAELLPHFADPNDFPVTSIVRELIKTDPEKAFELAARLKLRGSAYSVADLFLKNLQRFGSATPEAALDMTVRLADAFGDCGFGYSGMIGKYVRPEDLPDLASRVKPGTNHRVIAGVAEHWLEVDPDAALAWLGEFVPLAGSGRPESSGADAPAGEDIVSAIAGKVAWLGSDVAAHPEALIRFASVLPGDARGEFATKLAERLGQVDDPAAAEELLRKIAPTNPPLNEFTDSRFRALARQDPYLAAAELENVADPERRNAAVRATALEWARYDGYAASAWAAGLPAGDARDQAAVGVARSILQHDAPAAMAWAASIENLQLRATELDQLAESLPPERRAEVLEGAASMEISEEVQAAIRNALTTAPAASR